MLDKPLAVVTDGDDERLVCLAAASKAADHVGLREARLVRVEAGRDVVRSA